MELVMPRNYVEIEEEMRYLDGGGWSTFNRNLRGAWNGSINFARALRMGGWNWGVLTSMLGEAARYGFRWAVVKFALPIAKIGLIFGVITGAAAFFGASAVVWYLYNNRVFY